MLSPADGNMDALVRRREAEARAAHVTKVERILAIKDPAERMRVYADLTRGLEDGEALPADASARILSSLRVDTTPTVRPDQDECDRRAAQWAVERRHLALMHTLRPFAAAGCIVASLAPFAFTVWRMDMGMGMGMAIGAILAPWPLACIALSLVAAGLLCRQVDKAESLEGIVGLVVAAFTIGVASVAVWLVSAVLGSTRHDALVELSSPGAFCGLCG